MKAPRPGEACRPGEWSTDRSQCTRRESETRTYRNLPRGKWAEVDQLFGILSRCPARTCEDFIPFARLI
jgi:hypothetical protein